MVSEAFANGHYRTIAEIGDPAQPTFAALIFETADVFPDNVGVDPLYELLKINEARAAQLLLENLHVGGYLWKRRIVRIMDRRDVLNNEGTWSSEEPYICLEPEWLSVTEALLSSPDTALQSVHLVEEPFLRDQLTPGLQRALVHGIKSYDLDFTNELIKTIDHGGVVASAQPVFQALALHANPRVSRFALRLLTNYESDPVLKSFAGDSDPEVRGWIVQTLQPHTGNFVGREFFKTRWIVTISEVDHYPTLDEADRELLATLSEDPSPEVRRDVALVLAELTPALDDEVYLRLAADEDHRVRHPVANAEGLSVDLRLELLGILAKDSSKDVVYQVDLFLARATGRGDYMRYMEMLAERLVDDRVPMLGKYMGPIMSGLVKTPQGAQLAASLMLSTGNPQLDKYFFKAINESNYSDLLNVRGEELGAIFALIHDGQHAYPLQEGLSVFRRAPQASRSALLSVIANDSYARAPRLAAIKMVAYGGGPEALAALLKFVQSDDWITNGPNLSDLRDLLRVRDSLPSDERIAFQLEILKDASIPDSLAQPLVDGYERSGPHGREMTLAVIARWFSEDAARLDVVDQAIAHLEILPEDASSELVESITRSRSYGLDGVTLMRALHRAEFLPTLERYMQSGSASGWDSGAELRVAAAQAVASYVSEEAASILLRGLSLPDKEVREICVKGLEEIDVARARAASWAEARRAQPTKASALIELASMLDDETLEVRLQAIHGIATFGAIEYLPTMIRLLKDPSEEVVEAARQAIEDLSR